MYFPELNLVYTRFTSDAHPALAAPVTEIAFYTVPNTALEEAKTLIEASSVENTHPVITVGKSSGGAVGWGEFCLPRPVIYVFASFDADRCAIVFDTRNASDAAPEGQSIALHGVFGYGCVGDHVRWRGTVEHAMVIEDMGRSAMGRLGMGNAVVPGGNLFVRDSSMFHVRFQVG